MRGVIKTLHLFAGIILFGLISVLVGCGGDSGDGQMASGTFIAVGYGGNILTSPDGINWNVAPSGAGVLNGVVYGNNTFVAWQTSRSLSATILTSPDTINWIVRSSNTFPYLSTIIYKNGIFVAVSPLGVVLTSLDGMNWTNSATLTRLGLGSDPLQAITYGNGVFVTVGAFGGIYHSPDGVNWTTVSETFPPLYTVTCGNGIFVAAGGNEIFTSADGANWIGKTLDLFASVDILSLVHGNNMFVAVGLEIQGQGTNQPSTTLVILNSSDGVNWTGGLSTIDPGVNRLSFAQGIFFLTGINGTILTSPDGINWTSRISGTTEGIGAITFGAKSG